MIPGPAMTQLGFLLHIPLKILKPNLLVLRNRIMNGIHGVVNTLIHGLDSSGYIDLTLQFLGIILPDHCFQLLNQTVRFLLRDELGRLNGIHQKFKCRQCKGSVDHMIAITIAILFPFHFYSQYLQIPQVIVKTLSVCRNIILCKGLLDLRHGDIMLFIRFLHHNLRKSV